AKIVADRRSNSLVITATRESFPVLETLIGQLEEVPAASPVEYRIIPLKHASAPDVSYTLGRFARNLGDVREQPQIDYNRVENELIIAATADQFEQIEQIVAELDQPSERRRVTDFVPLKYAEAEQIGEALDFFYGPYAPGAETPGELNVQIVADPATNSLVISAHEAEWESIRALLAKLDSEEYDATLQVRVIPLTHADANSVARAINEAFQGRIERQREGGRPPQGRRRPEDGDRREAAVPAVLVEAEEWVRASAEPITNSVIVSASRSNIRKIEQIVERLDAANYAQLPPPQIIAVRHGSPDQLAEALRELYEQTAGRRGGGRRSLRIVGDAASNTVIVRAEEEEFRQIQALAEVLQHEASVQGLSVHVLKLSAAPAVRVASAIEEAFAAKARQEKLPFSIKVDTSGNSLVVACTGAMFAEIEATVEQLDELVPAPGQRIFIIELEHASPDSVRSVIESIGLDKPQPADSVSRLVTEPIKVSLLRGRNALVVVANAIDRDIIVELVKAIDAEPQLAQAQMRVIKLRRARAEALARILNDLLSPAAQQADTALARAVQEQVRRLSVHHDGDGPEGLRLDLTKPIRVIADPGLNALVISSTASNVVALEQVVLMFDQLPITDAVTVQIFPLENIAADQFARIVRDIFAQGKALGGVPGSPVEGVPEGMVGKALLDEIALSVDDRTNTLIAAGAEDAVALVEVLKQRLDADITNGWIEPRIIVLRHADATDLAIGRLRMARVKENGGRVLESDIFTPMTRLVIRPDSQLNALILVGTPVNLEVVSELTEMLDVEAASPDSTVRIYPIEHASAVRLATTVTRLFD
ncbi:MAG: secretin N-terminal domain-containing protein, partial [Planctomycetota bacterium]